MKKSWLIPLKDKHGWVVRDYVVATLVFSGMLALMYLMATNFATDYNRTDLIDPEFHEDFNKLQNNTESVASMFSSASSKEGLSTIGTLTLLFAATFSVISLVFTSLGVVGNQVSSFAQYFGIPAIVANVIFPMFLAILTTLIVFMIISSINSQQKL